MFTSSARYLVILSPAIFRSFGMLSGPEALPFSRIRGVAVNGAMGRGTMIRGVAVNGAWDSSDQGSGSQWSMRQW